MVVVGGGSYIVVGGRVVSLKSKPHMVKSSAEGSVLPITYLSVTGLVVVEVVVDGFALVVVVVV